VWVTNFHNHIKKPARLWFCISWWQPYHLHLPLVWKSREPQPTGAVRACSSQWRDGFSFYDVNGTEDWLLSTEPERYLFRSSPPKHAVPVYSHLVCH
jgi:hypothetical protein